LCAILCIVGIFLSVPTAGEERACIMKRLQELTEPTYVPPQFENLPLDLKELDSDALRRIRSGTPSQYIVDADDKIHLTSGVDLPAPETEKFLIAEATLKGGSYSRFLVKESGLLRYEPESKRFLLDSSYSLGQAEEELSESLARAKSLHPEEEFERAGNAGAPKSKVLNCFELISA